jgi:hypothetical protein
MTMRQSEWVSHEMRCDECARRLEEFRIWAEGFDVDAHGGDAYRLDGARDVTHGHMANGSASGQEDRVYSVILEHLCPLRRALLHQARNIGQSVIGVAALRQGTDHSLLGKFAKACQGKDHVDVLLRRADVVGHMPGAQAPFRCLRRNDAQRREALGSLARLAHCLLIGEFGGIVRVLVVQVDRS